MNFPDEYSYTKEHEWISVDDDNVATIGITEYAIEQLGDIVHVDLPSTGDEFEAGDSFGSVESTKTVSDLYTPIAGKVVEVNDLLTEEPETLQKSAYKKGWIVRIETADGLESNDDLLTCAEYEAYIAEDE